MARGRVISCFSQKKRGCGFDPCREAIHTYFWRESSQRMGTGKASAAPPHGCPSRSYAVPPLPLMLLLMSLSPRLHSAHAGPTPAGATQRSAVPFARRSSPSPSSQSFFSASRGGVNAGAKGRPPQTPRQMHTAVWGPGWSDDGGRRGGDGGGGGLPLVDGSQLRPFQPTSGGKAPDARTGSGVTSTGTDLLFAPRHELWSRHRGSVFARGEGRWRHATLALAKYIQVHRGILAAATASYRAQTAPGSGDGDPAATAAIGKGPETSVLASRGRGGTGGGGGGGRRPARFIVWHGAGVAGVPFARRVQAAASTLALALATGRAFMMDDPVLVGLGNDNEAVPLTPTRISSRARARLISRPPRVINAHSKCAWYDYGIVKLHM